VGRVVCVTMRLAADT